MAGGVGTRFWPMSTSQYPKQFHDILGSGKTLIQNTFNRLKKFTPASQIYVVTNHQYREITKENLPELGAHQIIEEPLAMNTAPCILYALLKVHNINPNARVLVAPSDHLIENEKGFAEIAQLAMNISSNQEVLITLGIKPSRPDTGYGYIQYIEGDQEIKKVKTFTEKPNASIAEKFVESGDFLWNAGIFVSSSEAFLNSFAQHMPEMYNLFTRQIELFNTPEEVSFIEQIYPRVKKQSIDYGIMEKAENVFVIPSDFGWSDLGTWSSIYDLKNKDNNGNVIEGERVYSYESARSLVRSEKKDKTIIMSGLEDYLVIDTDNALLICPKDQDQRIKEFVNDLRLNGESEFI